MPICRLLRCIGDLAGRRWAGSTPVGSGIAGKATGFGIGFCASRRPGRGRLPRVWSRSPGSSVGYYSYPAP
ncbi:hypothetical protein CSE45_1499 [Citreicella sp. SE45]|nr:hypothetical protein CSE45_1499 [Citreicella sp. SE45]